MKSLLLAAAVTAAAFVAPMSALAWGPEGHDVIAQVAYQRLSTDLQGKFDRIINGGQGLAVAYADSKRQEHSCGARTLNQLANWPDCVRYGGDYANTYEAHFDDIPYCPKPPAAKAPASVCAGKVCATTFLPQKIAELKAPGTKPFDRAAALAFIVHIVGDMHQPLHMIDNNDKGGNGISVTLDGRPTKLHTVWDGDVITHAYDTTAKAIDGTKELADTHASEWSNPHPVPGDFDKWAVATHAIAVQAYDAVTPKIACGSSGNAVHIIGDAYLDKFDKDVKEQLAKAAVRLSDVLIDALTAAP